MFIQNHKVRYTNMKKIKSFIHWALVKIGIKLVDYKMGCGYYITGGWFPQKTLEIGDLRSMKMQSGRVGIYELLSYENYTDPWDMTKSSEWFFLGYEGDKLIKDCTFKEYLEKYK